MNQAIKTRIEQIKRGEVPSGYKKTKIGISPAEWEEKQLGSIFKERKETNCDHFELLSITGERGVIPRTEIEGKDNSSEDKSKYKKICVGDIGYNTMRMWQGVSALSTYEGIVSPAYTVLSPSKDIDARYFWYCFKLKHNIDVFYRHSQGLVDDTRSLKYEWFAKIIFTVPSLKEQRKIADILKTQDRVIELKEKLLKEKQKEKKFLMQQLLTGKIRIKGFSAEWRKYEFSDIFQTLNYREKQIPKTQYLKYGRYPIIDQGKQLIIGYSNDLSKLIACPKKGVIIFGDHTREIKFYNNDFCIGGDGTQLLICKKGFIEQYLYFYLLNREIQSDGYNRHFKYIREFIYKLPMEEEQLAIVDIVSTKDKEIDLIKQQIENEKQKKKALMQLLLSGIVRVG